MFNVFKPKARRKKTKTKINEDLVVDFLNGGYERDAKFNGFHMYGKSEETVDSKLFKGKELEGIRAIETSYKSRDIEIIFAKAYRKKFGARIIHKNGLTPFLWSKSPKELLKQGFYRYNIIELDGSKVNESAVLLPNGDVRQLDGKEARILKTTEVNGSKTHWVRYKIKSIDEWKELINEKERCYGVEIERQIQSFDATIEQRMQDGFCDKITIEKNNKHKYSKNPYYKNPRQHKIKGSFNNLLDFYREGGISPRGSLYLNEDKLYKCFNSLAENKMDLINFYIHLYRWRKNFNPFTKDSCDFNKLIKYYKIINPDIAFKINKTYINEEIEKDPSKFFNSIGKFVEHIVNNKLDKDKVYQILLKTEENKAETYWNDLYSDIEGKVFDSIFNIQLDSERVIKYILEPYTFDNSRDTKDLVEYIDSNEFDLYHKIDPQLFFVNPLEQYMIQTGRRLFKGIDNYKDLEVLTVDIETTAIKGCEHLETAALFPETGRVFQIGIGDNKDYFKILHAKTPDEEQGILEDTYRLIAERDADVILTYHGEGFDWPFMEKRLELLGCKAEAWKGEYTVEQYIRNLMIGSYDDYGNVFSFFAYRRNTGAILKVGGDTEDYTQTKMYGKNICDVMFAVKRAAALDKRILNNKLKYNIIHAKLAAENRVYIQGDKIGFLEQDERPYYLNRENGKYFVGKKALDFSTDEYIPKLVKEGEDGYFYNNKKELYLYTDDGSDKYDFLKNCINTFGIKIRYDGELLNDGNLFTARQIIDEQFTGFYQKSLPYETVKCPIVGIGRELDEIGSKNVFAHLISKLKFIRSAFEDVKDIYQMAGTEEVNWKHMDKVSGSFLVNEYLRFDIKEPYLLDELYSQPTFALAKWLPTKYEKIATMGNANVWKLLLAAWSYLNTIAIPNYEEPKNFTGGLLGMVEAGYHRNIVKIDYSSLYPSEFLQHCDTPEIDITGIYKMLVGVALNLRLDYKKKMNIAKAKGDSATQQYYDKKQLPLKILINSFYGMLGAPKVSPFAHIKSAWHITCSGRQHMRHLIHWFKPYGFKIIYFHTDGANFVIPENVDDYSYVSNGANWKNTKGVKYIGVEAYVAEYNDKFMKGKMAVDIDEYALSCINFSKGNFSYLKEKKGKYVISHVGGTLTKKDQNQYIIDFFADHLEKLFLGDGASFLDAYYQYVKKIYNQNIVAGKIANKKRVTRSIEDYLRRIKDENGIKQAHMELAIMDNLQVNKGDWLYTINNGNGKKDSGDLKKVNDVIGFFKLPSKEHCEVAVKRLKKHLEDLNFVKKAMLSAEKNNQFTFNNEYVSTEIVDLFETKISRSKISKRKRIDDIFNAEEVEFKIKSKLVAMRDNKNKFIRDKNGKNKKETIYIVEVVYVVRNLNAMIVSKENLDAKLPYNPMKYIEKFNKAIKKVLIVFHPELRGKILTPNRKQVTGEDYDRKPNQRGWFEDKELELISGFPLKGDEDKQQDLDELLIVTEEEMDFWKEANLSPNNSLDYQAVNTDGEYEIALGRFIYPAGVKNWNDDELYHVEKYTGVKLMEWLKDKIILDYVQPPYVFYDAKGEPLKCA